MALLPLREFDGQTLDFHVGIADIEELTQNPVDLDALGEVNQFLYMGAEDTNDTIPYDDAWTEEELRQLALDVYGDDMVEERFPRCQEAYREAGIDAQFKIYDDIGHSMRGITDDLVEYHRRSVAGEDVTDFGETIVTEVTFDVTPENPERGDQVEFNASESQAGVGEIINFSWDFDDGTTATGETTVHTYDTSGSYDVTLSVIDDNGTVYEAAKTVETENEGEDSSASDLEEENKEESESDDTENKDEDRKSVV